MQHTVDHIGMRIKGPPCEAKIGRPVFAEAAHEPRLAAKHPAGIAASQGLSIGNHIRLDTKIRLSAARAESKAKEDFIKNQHNAALSAKRPQLLEPGCVASTVKSCTTTAVHKRRVTRRRAIRMQSLERIHQNAGHILAHPQGFEGAITHILQGIRFAWRHRISWPWLHILPPTVIGATKPHHMGLAGVIACQSDGLHHCFGTRHVKGDFVLRRENAKSFCHFDDCGVVHPQYGTKCLGSVISSDNIFLIKVIT